MSAGYQKLRDVGVAGILLGLTWFGVIRILWGDWRIDPQYGYGIIVPLLMFGLLLRRFPDRPVPQTPRGNAPWIAGVPLLGACLALMILIPFAEANPDWRPIGLLASIAGVSITLAVICLHGGLPWLRHFAFPVCFFLIAVPWPRNFEQSVMGALMSWNAAATLEILHWLGYEALRQGNLIVIPSGVLGVEEACSGIRSLQSGMMVSLFFGEVLRLVPWRRVLLVSVAIVGALAGNIVRSSLLGIVASRQGISSVSSWHDFAGFLILIVTFGAVMACAYRWRAESVHPGMHGIDDGSASAGTLSFGILLSACISLSLVLGGTEAWYRVHEADSPLLRNWSLEPIGPTLGGENVPIPQQTLRMLYYPEGFSERWPVGDSAGGQAFYLRWPSGRTSLQAVSMHNPEVCLASIGMSLVVPLPSYTYESNGITIPFRVWLFQQRGVPVYVFQALIEEGRKTGVEPRGLDDTFAGRLRSVLEGRRNLGQRMIEVACWNLTDEGSAVKSLDNYLKRALKVEMVPASMKQ